MSDPSNNHCSNLGPAFSPEAAPEVCYQQVPEPATLPLILIGIAAMAIVRHWSTKHRKGEQA